MTNRVTLDQKLMVGASAGILGTSVVYPLDIIKTQLQTQPYKKGQSLLSSTYNSMKFILSRSNGPLGFYRGFGACLVGIAPEKAIKLAVNDAVRDYYTVNQTQAIKIHQEIIAGSIAGFLQLFVTVPYESVKIRLQMQTNIDVSKHQTGLQIAKSLGVVGIYRGFTATFLRDVPFCVIFFPLYSNIKQVIQDNINKGNNKEVEPFYLGLVSGIIAGAISGGLVTPADMIKTRTQQGFAGEKGFIEYGKEIVKTEGVSALYRGWHTRMLVIAPLYGLVSLAFEVQKRWLTNSL